MNKYVLIFLFNHDINKVALIKKNRPSFQAGKHNGIGGKIEVGETEAQAIIREVYEECGLIIDYPVHYATLTGNTFNVACFYKISDISAIQSKTDEEITVYDIKEVVNLPSLNNLNSLLYGALAHINDNTLDKIKFTYKE